MAYEWSSDFVNDFIASGRFITVPVEAVFSHGAAHEEHHVSAFSARLHDCDAISWDFY